MPGQVFHLLEQRAFLHGALDPLHKWQKYTVSLANRNLGQIISGFVWVVEGGTAPVTFYLDDIQYD